MVTNWLAELDGRRVVVEVPASSANLGAGYDCLGVALGLFNQIEVEVRGWSRGENLQKDLLPPSEPSFALYKPRNQKIVYDNAFEAPGSPRMVVTLTYEEENGQTTMTIHTLFESIAMKNEYVGHGMMQGYGSALDQLADLVAELQGAGVA